MTTNLQDKTEYQTINSFGTLECNIPANKSSKVIHNGNDRLEINNNIKVYNCTLGTKDNSAFN